MAVTKDAANFAWKLFDGDQTPDLALPTAVPAGAVLIVAVLDRSGNTATITGISDSVHGAWSGAPQVGPFAVASTQGWIAYRLNSGAGTPTVTVTFDSAINSQVVVGWIASDLGAMTFDAVSASATGTGTDVDSELLAAAGAGAFVGVAMMNNSQTAVPTADGVGEIVAPASNGSGQRVWAVLESYAGAGNVGFGLTLATSATWTAHVLGFLEPGGAPPTTGAPRMLLMGVG